MITEEQLLEVFAAYNPQIWPMQIVAYVLGIVGTFFAVRRSAISGRVVPAVLAFFWLWVAIFFWFPSVQQGFVPGYLFTAMFLVQGGLFLLLAFKARLAFGFNHELSGWIGLFFVLYALVGYPVLGALAGHVYPRMSPFGLTPCPVVAFSFGLLLLARVKVPKALLVIPFLYSMSGLLWISIGMFEDIGMFASGVMGVWLIGYRNARRSLDQMDKTRVTVTGGWSLNLPDKK